MQYVLALGPTSTWLWTELKRLAVICIDARHAKAVLKMQINKSDRKDAIGIARMMQIGWFKEVHVKDIDSHSARALLASQPVAAFEGSGELFENYKLFQLVTGGWGTRMICY
jgi:hypothetical protein